MAKQKTPPPLRLEFWDPERAKENPLNWRSHPPDQGASLDAVLDRAGWAGAALYNELSGCLIDGHLRKERAIERNELLPVLIGSWTPDQERLILVTLDPLAALAAPISERLSELGALLGDTGSALGALLERQLAEANLADLMAEMETQLAGLQKESPGDDGRGGGLESGRARVRPVVWLENLANFERALLSTGRLNRGEALADVCRFYLEHHGGE